MTVFMRLRQLTEHVSYHRDIDVCSDHSHETRQLREHVSYHRDIDVCSDHSHETKTTDGACFIP